MGDLAKLVAPDFEHPEYLSLEANISNLQSVKKDFLRRFRRTAGRQAVKDSIILRDRKGDQRGGEWEPIKNSRN